jgi:hypothetical protein
MAAELADYLIPRVGRLAAPPLAVIGGSTGVGKSTLLNSLLQSPISPSGVIRPTTRTPVLVHHPDDRRWFTGHAVEGVQVTGTPAVPAGIALLDAPDVDSVVEGNRHLGRRLLASADLWLFVTTAARYADAVPWDLLRAARNRSTAIALILNRVPPEGREEITESLRSLLETNDLADLALFVVPETPRDHAGLIAADLVAPVLNWLIAIAGSPALRSAVVRQSLGGAIDLIEPTTTILATAVDHQRDSAARLARLADEAHTNAARVACAALRDGTLMSGEVSARWHRLATAPDLLWTVPTRIGRLPDRVDWLRDRSTWLRHRAGWTRDRAAWSRERAATLFGRGGRVPQLWQALSASLTTLLCCAAMDAGGQTRESWLADPAGAELLGRLRHGPDEGAGTSGLTARAAAVVEAWREGVKAAVLDAARASEAKSGGRRIWPRALEVSTTLTCALACAGTSFRGTGALQAIFGTAGAEDLIATAVGDLTGRVEEFCGQMARRHRDVLAGEGIDETAGDRLRALGRETTIARLCTGLPAARMAPPDLPTAGHAPQRHQHDTHQHDPHSSEGSPWPASSTS